MNSYFNNLNPKLKQYFNILNNNIPRFLYKYLEVPEIQRLKGIGYLCGMDYCSKEAYDFEFYYSRLDHSVATALMTWHFTHDKKQTIAALLHDIATPIFSHVIDYMNGDTVEQETTEKRTEGIIRGSKVLLKCLKKDAIDVDDVVDCKKYSIVDNDRPKLCTDRLDSLFMLNVLWTKTLSINEIKNIYDNISDMKEDEGKSELGTDSLPIARRVVDLSVDIGYITNSEEDYFCMQLLAKITRLCIKAGYFTEDFLYTFDEPTAIDILDNVQDKDIKMFFNTFLNINAKRMHKFDTLEKVNIDNFYVHVNEIKRKYVDILVRTIIGVRRASRIDLHCHDAIEDYKEYKPKKWVYAKRHSV